MQEISNYILQFLLHEPPNSPLLEAVGYTSDATEFARYKVVIVKSDFFDDAVYGTAKSLPKLPLKEIENMPFLYGEDKIERQGDTIILHADLIASTYFLISRYEEILRREVRDQHGRFIGKKSLPGQAGFIHRPIVDEYGAWLRRCLHDAGCHVNEPQRALHQIYLTHDVDAIAHYRNIRSVVGALISPLSKWKGAGGEANPAEAKIALKTYFGGIQHDPWFTFPTLLKQNHKLKNRAETIVFVKSGGGKSPEDKPRMNTASPDFQYLFELLKNNDAKIGLHASYAAGIAPNLVASEKTTLKHSLPPSLFGEGLGVRLNRHHYLSSREPEDMQGLIEANITDDFTMGYADVAGFRLGTCRAVRWINPNTKTLTSLWLHPLTAMDGTLNDERYMHLNENEAYDYVTKLIDVTQKYNGDVCLLWHNTSIAREAENYLGTLYNNLIDYLATK
ncbi:polysaccharide deacetylase [Bacteroidia bacterium]|nr:polysaccharide deacetylase [Bacteroidia bacterium]